MSSGGKVKIRQDGATGKFSAEYYIDRTDVTPTVATLARFDTPEEALEHIRTMFPDAALEP